MNCLYLQKYSPSEGNFVGVVGVVGIGFGVVGVVGIGFGVVGVVGIGFKVVTANKINIKFKLTCIYELFCMYVPCLYLLPLSCFSTSYII